ncbi:MAG: hypothetical protein K2H38_07720 [Muribaculaceae bacterium]|nr:hypothetical protein [Muribaculaceae bacterium]
MNAWKNIGFPNPDIHEEEEVNEVWLTLPLGSLAEDNSDEETSNVASDGGSNGGSDDGSNGGSNGGSDGGSNKGKDSLKKRPYTILCKQIIEYCNSWRSNKEIAESLGYDVKYLGSRVIPRMVAEGLLEKLDKESNRSPKQKYRAIKRTDDNV